jgi:hypothetical protein
MKRSEDVGAFIRAVVAFPLVLAVVVGVLSKKIGHWEHGDLVIWLLYPGLLIAVWFPFILRPYLKRTAARK